MTTSRKTKKEIPGLTMKPITANVNVTSSLNRMQEIHSYISNTSGMKLSDFRVHELIGRGQYGEVKRVTHIPSDTIMALKVINIASQEVSKNQVVKELEVLKSSKSPYIVNFFGAFVEDTYVYYCMEFMEYGSVDRLSKRGVPEVVLAKIAIAMVEGLKYMKDELNKMHRDVKPTNVLANKKGEVKLCDFGIAAELQQSIANSYIGCSLYMAPERINTQENSSGYGVYSDVWSVGLSLIEIAHGRAPYPNFNNLFDQLNAIVSGDPPKLDSQKFSEEAQEFIALCLQKDFKKRPTYSQLLEHRWILKNRQVQFDMAAWMLEVANQQNL